MSHGEGYTVMSSLGVTRVGSKKPVNLNSYESTRWRRRCSLLVQDINDIRQENER